MNDGRKTDVISVSGFEVWPRAAEDAICACPGVRDAAVSGKITCNTLRDGLRGQ